MARDLMAVHSAVYVTDRPEIHRHLAIEAAPPQLEIEMLVSPTKGDIVSAVRGAEFLISERTGSIDADIIEAGDRLRLIQRLGSRHHDIDLVAATRAGVPVCAWPLPQSSMVAEHTMMLVLALAKRARDCMNVLIDGSDWGEPMECDANTFAMNWTQRSDITMLAGATVGIVAMGEIGTELAQRLRSFGCDVAYNNRRRLPESAETALGVRYLAIDDLLGHCSIVCLLMPYSSENVSMTDAKFLSKMRPGSLLVSCGASTTLDEHAVAEAYSAGHLGGVASDGHRWEPTRPDGPLVNLSRDPTTNVVLTPHSAQGGVRLTRELREPEYSNIVNVLDGRPLLHRLA